MDPKSESVTKGLMDLKKEQKGLPAYRPKKKAIIPNANTIVMGLAILLLIAIIGLVLYFNDRYSVISSQYSTEMSNIENLKAQMDAREAQIEAMEATLEAAKGNLSIKEQRESSLAQEYTSLEETKGQLEGALTQTQDDLTQCTSDLGATKTRLLEANSDRDLYKQYYLTKLNELSNAYKSIDDLQKEVNSLNDCLNSHNLSSVC